MGTGDERVVGMAQRCFEHGQLLPDMPAAVCFVLVDNQDNVPNVRAMCDRADRVLVASRHGGYAHAGHGPRSAASSTS